MPGRLLPDSPASSESGSDYDLLEPIAVVGVGFKGPGDATNVENFWRMIVEGREAWSPIPKERWNNDAYYHPDGSRFGTHNVKGGHFIKQDLSQFDAKFFNLTEDEAKAMDPQHRLLLETAYESFENAGWTLDQVKGSRTSSFVGTFSADYADLLQRDASSLPMFACTNAAPNRAVAANRLAHFYDLSGPSVALDTACSSSLVALHLACQSIRTGEADSAVAAGVNMILHHEFMNTMSSMGMLSPDGRCYTFDQRANGYARGEGVGCVVLKPLASALRDGDPIRAIIRNTGSNHDGKTPGITAPSGEAQEALMRHVYHQAGLDPLDTSYVELHGTGTPKGDPIETGSCSRVFSEHRSDSNPLTIGSVKSNVGHLEGASGMAGLIKVILMCEKEMIAPNRNFETPNPAIKLDEWKMRVCTSLEPWKPNNNKPHRASVNSFGYGGTNAHAIVESARDFLASVGVNDYTFVPDISTTTENALMIPKKAAEKLFLISGFSQASVKAQTTSIAAFAAEHPTGDESFMSDLAFTLSEKRSHFPWRVAVSAETPEALSEKLGKVTAFQQVTKTPKLGFVFTGQGAQWATMGKALIESSSVVRKYMERISSHLTSIGAPYNAIDALLDPSNAGINEPIQSQPLCSAVQIALVELYRSWGINPSSVTGHSSGEIASAYTLGVLDVEDAMTVAYQRGRTAQSILSPEKPTGAMMAVGMSADAAEARLPEIKTGKAVVACVNSPTSVTVSGDVSAVDELQEILQAEGVFARKLAVTMAYHSHHMQKIADEYIKSISHIKLRQPIEGIEFFSSVTGQKAQASDLGPSYWQANLLHQVKFAQALDCLIGNTGIESEPARRRKPRARVNQLLEIGPHAALGGPIKQIISANPTFKDTGIQYGSALVRKQDAVETAFQSAASLWCNGYALDIAAINQPSSGKKQRKAQILTELPPYSWDHATSYWDESRVSQVYKNKPFPRHDLLGSSDDGNTAAPTWRNHLRASEIPWVTGHRIQSNTIFPAAGYIAMAIEAASQWAGNHEIQNISSFRLQDITFVAPLVVPETDSIETVLTFKPRTGFSAKPSDSEYWNEFHISSVSSSNRWTTHCFGFVGYETGPKSLNPVNGKIHEEAEGAAHAAYVSDMGFQCQTQVDVEELYKRLTEAGLDYGDKFRNLTQAHAADRECVGKVQIPDTAASMPAEYELPMLLHPATLDAAFHCLFVAANPDPSLQMRPAVPSFIHELSVSTSIANTAGHELDVYSSISKKNFRGLTASFRIDDNHTPLVKIDGLNCSFIDGASESDSLGNEESSVAYNLSWRPDSDFLPSTAMSLDNLIADMGHKNPNAHVLEIGSSTHLQSYLDLKAEYPLFEKYICTVPVQVSSGPVKDLVKQIVLDLDKDATEQGFAAEQFDDIFLSASILESAASVKDQMRHIHKILKRSGRLIMTTDIDSSGLVEILDRTGFEVEYSSVSYHLVRKESLPADLPQEVQIIANQEEQTEMVSTNRLIERLEEINTTATVVDLASATPSGKTCIVLSEVNNPIMASIDETRFDVMKKILLESKAALWVTRGAGLVTQNPASNVVTGVVRTARSENGGKSVVTLDLDCERPLSPENASDLIFNVFAKRFDANGNNGMAEMEYAERDGAIQIPRVVPDTATNKTIDNYLGVARPTKQPFHQESRALQATITNPGHLDSASFVEDVRVREDLPDDQAEIKVLAVGLNRHDLIVGVGQSDVQSLGLECSGVVTAVGSQVADLKPGDRVACAGSGVLTSVYRDVGSRFRKLANTISLELAASVPVDYCTAYHAVFNLAKLQKGESVLVHSGAESLGQALIEMVLQISSSEVFTTVSSAEEKRLMMDLGIHHDHIFYSGDDDFAQGIKRATNGQGVDAVMNTLGAKFIPSTMACVAVCGRFIELSDRNELQGSHFNPNVLASNAQYISFDLSTVLKYRVETFDQIWEEVSALLNANRIRGAIPLHISPIAELSNAMSSMQQAGHHGKIVVTAGDDSEVMAPPKQEDDSSLLEGDVSYLLVGGLGGIGRAISVWMVEHGARNLIFANRSGLAKQEAKDTVTALENMGVKVSVQSCDVSDASAVSDMIKNCSESMPPIRGVIQAAMVLKDGMMENMTHEDYEAVIRSKVPSTQNLHDFLPKDMDFFVMLSSVSGIIGNTAQAAYSGGNTFLDAMAAYRNAQGLPAAAIDLGAIKDVGYLAEEANKELAAGMERQGFKLVDTNTMLALIRHGIAHPYRQGTEAHIISGLGEYVDGQSMEVFDSAMFSHFRRQGLGKSSGAGGQDGAQATKNKIKADLGAATTLDDAANIIFEAFAEKVAERNSVPVDTIDAGHPITDYGVDSLVAVEFRNWITKTLEGSIAIMELLANRPLLDLSKAIAQTSKLVKLAS